MSEHTPEPWQAIEGNGAWLVVTPPDEWGRWYIAKTMDIDGGQQDEANARRIVAAVNACAGIQTEALEQPDASVLTALDELKGLVETLLVVHSVVGDDPEGSFQGCLDDLRECLERLRAHPDLLPQAWPR